MKLVGSSPEDIGRTENMTTPGKEKCTLMTSKGAGPCDANPIKTSGRLLSCKIKKLDSLESNIFNVWNIL